MATVTKSSINVSSGGVFALSSATTLTPFSLAAGQYAIVTITNMSLTTGPGATGTASVVVGGSAVMQINAPISSTASLVQGVATTTAVSANPVQLYVANSFAVSAAGSGITVSIIGSYVIFQNT